MIVLKFLGWLFVPYIMILLSWKRLGKTGRGFGTTWAAIALLMVIVNLIGNKQQPNSVTVATTNQSQQAKVEDAKLDTNAQAKNETDKKAKADADEAKAKADAEAKAKAEEEAKKANQESVLAFEKSTYDLEDTATPIFDQYKKVMGAVSQGDATVFDAYDITTKAKEAAQNLQLKFVSLKVADNLPNDVKDLLNGAKQDLSTAYYSRKNAYDAVLKYLDDQKPSNMQKFKDETQMADQFVLSGVTKIMDAKNKVGIDITATKQ